MKEVTMLILRDCPYCQRAFAYIEQYKEKHPDSKDVSFIIIDEEKEPERASQFDYWYVPTFFVGGEKIHEGVTDVQLIDDVFQKAMA